MKTENTTYISQVSQEPVPRTGKAESGHTTAKSGDTRAESGDTTAKSGLGYEDKYATSGQSQTGFPVIRFYENTTFGSIRNYWDKFRSFTGVKKGIFLRIENRGSVTHHSDQSPTQSSTQSATQSATQSSTQSSTQRVARDVDGSSMSSRENRVSGVVQRTFNNSVDSTPIHQQLASRREGNVRQDHQQLTGEVRALAENNQRLAQTVRELEDAVRELQQHQPLQQTISPEIQRLLAAFKIGRAFRRHLARKDKDQIRALQSKVERLEQNQAAGKIQNVFRLHMQKKRYESQMTAQNTIIENMTGELRRKDQELEVLQGLLATQHKELEVLREQINQVSKRKSELEAFANGKERDINALRHQLRLSEDTVKKANGVVEKLTDDLRQKTGEFDELKQKAGEFDELQQKLEGQNKIITSLRAELQKNITALQEAAKESGERKDLLSQISALKEEIKALEQAAQESEERKELLSHNNHFLELTLKERKEQITKLTSQVEKLQDEVNGLQDAVHGLTGEVELTDAMVAVYEAENAHNEKVKSLLNSPEVIQSLQQELQKKKLQSFYISSIVVNAKSQQTAFENHNELMKEYDGLLFHQPEDEPTVENLEKALKKYDAHIESTSRQLFTEASRTLIASQDREETENLNTAKRILRQLAEGQQQEDEIDEIEKHRGNLEIFAELVPTLHELDDDDENDLENAMDSITEFRKIIASVGNSNNIRKHLGRTLQAFKTLLKDLGIANHEPFPETWTAVQVEVLSEKYKAFILSLKNDLDLYKQGPALNRSMQFIAYESILRRTIAQIPGTSGNIENVLKLHRALCITRAKSEKEEIDGNDPICIEDIKALQLELQKYGVSEVELTKIDAIRFSSIVSQLQLQSHDEIKYIISEKDRSLFNIILNEKKGALEEARVQLKREVYEVTANLNLLYEFSSLNKGEFTFSDYRDLSAKEDLMKQHLKVKTEMGFQMQAFIDHLENEESDIRTGYKRNLYDTFLEYAAIFNSSDFPESIKFINDLPHITKGQELSEEQYEKIFDGASAANLQASHSCKKKILAIEEKIEAEEESEIKEELEAALEELQRQVRHLKTQQAQLLGIQGTSDLDVKKLRLTINQKLRTILNNKDGELTQNFSELQPNDLTYIRDILTKINISTNCYQIIEHAKEIGFYLSDLHETYNKDLGFAQLSQEDFEVVNRQFLAANKGFTTLLESTIEDQQAEYMRIRTTPEGLVAEAKAEALEQAERAEANAATKIQARFRGHQGRAKVLEQAERAEANAATKIQARFRGHQGREKALEQAEKAKVEAKAQAENWAIYEDDDGQTYYYNTVTEKTQWEKPEALEQAEAKAKAEAKKNRSKSKSKSRSKSKSKSKSKSITSNSKN